MVWPTSGQDTWGRRAAIAAPRRPPISACVDDEGRPKYQVSRFHTMAATSAARMMTSATLTPSSLAMVFDTFPPKTNTVISAPVRLNTAETTTAVPGESARVDTEVAIAL